MPTTFANTINSNEILAKRSQCDYAGNDIQTTYATKTEVTTGLASKQDTLTAGTNITISSNTISATDTTYSAGTGIDITNNVVSVDNTVAMKSDLPTVDQTYDGSSTNAQSGVAVASAISGKQDTLTAGSNITISSNTISATDTTYSAGTGIDITNNEISVEAPVDIVAGPGIVIDNPDGNTLRVSQSTFGAWEDISSQFTWASNVSDNHIVCLYNSSLKLLYIQGFAQINVGTSNTQIGTLPNNLRPIARIVEVCAQSTLEEKHGVLSTNEAKDAFTFKWITQPSNKYVGVFLITPVEEI